MKKKLQIAITVCLLLLLSLQLYWISGYKKVQQINFNKTINNVLEKTILDEQRVRADSLGKKFYQYLMDTSWVDITSRVNPDGRTVYEIWDKRKEKGVVSSIIYRGEKIEEFGLAFTNKKITRKDSTTKKEIAGFLVNRFRSEYINNGVIYFYTQEIGDSLVALADKIRNNKNFVADLYRSNLLKERIRTKFKLYVIQSSDTTQINAIEHKAFNNTASQTKLFISALVQKTPGKNFATYLYAVFENSFFWIGQKMFLVTVLSILVVALITLLILYFYKALGKEKELNILKNDFIDNMTHELKTPIANISAAAEAMQHFGVLGDTQKTNKYLLNIRGQAQYLDLMVTKVLEISSFENQEIALQKEWISVKTLLSEIAGNHFLVHDTNSLQINFTQDPSILIHADPLHFKNLLLNLIDNAIKYNNKKQPEVSILVQSLQDDLVIRISDNGQGIAKEHLDRLFDKFYRVPTGNIQAVRGFGLGLFYVKRIIDLHGWSISVESKTGEGTSFYMHIPNSSFKNDTTD